jgi:hypothetical protein
MRSTLMAATLALFAVAQPVLSAEGDSEFQITPRIGQGELRIDAFEGVNDELHEMDTYGLGIGFGVKTPIGLLFEVGGDWQGKILIFDDDDKLEFNLTQRYIAVGYQLELGDGWRLIPKVSRARWKLRSDEGLFDFNDDDEREMRGYEYVYEATIGRKVSRVLTLGLNYKHGEYDFGRARVVSFVVQLGI